MTTVMDGHVEIDEQGIARISRSGMKVIHLVMEKMANGWTAEQLQQNFPHLTPAQIYAALAYYHDHKREIDQQIDQSLAMADRAQSETKVPHLLERLRAEGRLP